MRLHSRQAVYVFALIFAVAASAHAQVRYAAGQSVAPAFEGWERNPDGTFNMVFGYLNRNYEEEVDIPIGPNNTIEPDGPDRGQPTHFYPRRQRFVFRVMVPKDWDQNRKVVWTLTAYGRTDSAKGWLQPEWELNPGVISENSGAGVADENNTPPSIGTASPAQTIALPNPVTLTVSATDDGFPKPRPRRPRPDPSAAAAAANPDTTAQRPEGLRIKWIHYRGPGKVTFEPENAPAVYGTPVTLTTKASFSAAGTYVVRAVASDGASESIHDVTVTVNPGTSAQNR